MQQKFLSNLALLIILNLVVKPISILGIDAAVQNKVGAASYGLYFSLLNFTFLFNVLLDFGINNFTTKNVAQYPSLMSKYLGRIAGLRLILFVVYAIFTLFIALLLGYESEVYPILFVLIVQQFLISMIGYFRSYLSGMMLFKWDAVMSVLDRALLIVLCLVAFYLTHNNHLFSIELFIWIQFICYFISFVIGGFLVMKTVGRNRLQINKTFSFYIIKQSYPYAILIVLMILYTRIDSVMLERMLPSGAEQAGFYAQGFRLIDAFFMFAMLFSNLLLPIFSRMIKEKESVVELFKTSAKLLVFGAIVLAALCYFNSHAILSLLYTNDIDQSAEPFQLLMITFVAMCIILIFGTYLTALGDMKMLNWIALIGLLLNVLFNVYLIPKFGVVGAAFSTLVTQFAVAIAQFIIVCKKLQIRFDGFQIGAFVLFVTVCFGSMYFLTSFQVHLLLQLLVCAIILLVFKVIRPQFILQLLKSKQ